MTKLTNRLPAALVALGLVACGAADHERGVGEPDPDPTKRPAGARSGSADRGDQSGVEAIGESSATLPGPVGGREALGAACGLDPRSRGQDVVAAPAGRR